MLKMEILTILPCNTMVVSENWKIMPSQTLCGGRQVTRHIQLQCLCHILSTKMPPSGWSMCAVQRFVEKVNMQS